MAELVVLGAGLSGTLMAYELVPKLRKGQDRVTVIGQGSRYHFVPSNPWVAIGWREKQDIEVDLEEVMRRKGIRYFPQGARRLFPNENRIELEDGNSVTYDYLVIATGPDLAFDEIPGLGPDGETQSICHVDHATKAKEAFERFAQAPGPIVVGAVQGASCFGPAYEFAFILDTELRKRGLRDRVPMTFVTSEPYVGHLGLDGVGDTKGLLESEMRDRHIKWITNAKVTKVESGKMHVTEFDDMGKEKRTHEVPFKYSMMLPAFKGIDAVFGIEGLTNPRGFIVIDEHQRNPKYRNVYSVGVCVAIPPVEQTPVPTGAPKTGYMIESMVEATAANIRAELDGRQPAAKATWNAVCLADFGDSGAAFVALPQIPPRNVNWFSEGKWVHLAKVGFERYFIRKMKRGSADPVYEKLVMHALGIRKLKDAA
jgi:sulfide:quinone oxidoreductase